MSVFLRFLLPRFLPLLTGTLLLGGVLAAVNPLSFATELPPGLTSFIKQKDPRAQVRFDGLVSFSNGEVYLPVFPQNPDAKPDPVLAISQKPESVAYPDYIQFDNNLFLIRLLPTEGNRLTLGKLDEYPIQLKSGLLPQDLLLPENLFIPAELKIILGNLPYNPRPLAVTPEKQATKSPAQVNRAKMASAKSSTKKPPQKSPEKGAKKLSEPLITAAEPVVTALQPILSKNDPLPVSSSSTVPTTDLAPSLPHNLQGAFAPSFSGGFSPLSPVSIPDQIVFLSDLTHQGVLVLQPNQSAQKPEVIDLSCVPSSLLPLPQQGLLAATCLTSNDVVMIDTHANLVKTRIPVDSRPGNLLYFEADGQRQLWVSNRYNKQISTIRTDELTAGSTLSLPGSGGVMVYAADLQAVLVADTAADKLYRIDVRTQKSVQEMKTLPHVSAMWLDEAVKGYPLLWLASRTENKLQLIDPNKGVVISTVEVGKKPIAMIAGKGSAKGKLYIACADDARIDIIDKKRRAVVGNIPLPEGFFPSGLTLAADPNLAYVSSAGSNDLAIINLSEARLEKTIGLGIRSIGVTAIGDPPPNITIEPDEPDVAALQPANQDPDKDPADASSGAVDPNAPVEVKVGPQYVKERKLGPFKFLL